MPILIAILMVAAALLGLGLTVSGIARFRRSNAAPGPEAGFADTLRRVPLRLCVGLDLLDLGLDVLAAPLAWLLLDRAGLKPLRGVAALEAVIPFTQAIPLMTLCWLGVRLGDRFGIRIGPVGGDDAAIGDRPRRRVENTSARPASA